MHEVLIFILPAMLMVVGQGFNVILARKKAATWGTAISVNEVLRQLPILSETMNAAVNYVQDETLFGSPVKRAADTGAKTGDGAIALYARYDGLDLDIAMCMGRSATPVSKSTLPPYAYYNAYTIKDDLEGYFVTMAIDKEVAIHEWASVKYNGFTLRGTAGDRMIFEFALMPSNLSIPAIVNTSLGAVTEPIPRMHIMFEHCRFLMNAESGSALVSGVDDIYPSDFELTVNNNLSGDLTSENDPYIDEPLRNGFMEITGNFTIPKYKSTTVDNAFLAGTKQKMAIRMISSSQINSVGGGAYYYEQTLYLPSVLITDAARPVDGAGQLPGTFNFEAYTPDSAPSGMDGTGSIETSADDSRSAVSGALVIEVTNSNQANPLT